MQNKIEINDLNHVSCFLIYTMIRISDSNPFDLNQAHVWGGLVCGFQQEPSEDKGRVQSGRGTACDRGGLAMLVFKVPSYQTIPCFKVPPHSLGLKC